MKRELRFDEGFDNILIYDYDTEYRNGPAITADTLFDVSGRAARSLDGDWHFCPDVFHSTVRSRWFDEVRTNRDNLPIPYDFDFDAMDCIHVPGVWNDQKREYALYEGPGVYFKEFDCQKAKGRRVFLRIGAANYETRIWLNRKYLGRHLGGFTPFCTEITSYLKEEGNRLLVLVDNTRRGEQIPSAHYDWFNYGGIHRSVELVEVPETFVKRFQIALSKNVKNQIEYRVEVEAGKAWPAGETAEAVIEIEELGIRERVQCVGSSGAEAACGGTGTATPGTVTPGTAAPGTAAPSTAAPSAAAPAGAPAPSAPAVLHATGIIPVDEAAMHLWSPESPYLYKVKVTCAGDCLTDEIGFRRIDRDGTTITLNGKPVLLRGMCVHEESPEHLRAVTGEDMAGTLREAKELGCNFLRLTHYPHSEAMARLADRMGIMLWEEIPVYWALEFENPATFADAANQLREMILRDCNRASVIVWSVGNENPDTDARYHFMRRLAERAKELDGSRLIGASCLIDVEERRIRDRLIDSLDVVGLNEYYGWYLKDFGVLREILNHYEENKPVVITETGAEAVPGMHGAEDEIYTEECQAAIYRMQFDTLFSYPFIKGTTPWVLYDYASMRRMSSLQKGYNLKGIISADREHRKLAYQVVKEAYGRRAEQEEKEQKER